MAGVLKKVAEAAWFQNVVTVVILFAGWLVGVETYPSVVAEWGALLHAADVAVLAIFVVELLVKLGAEGRQPWRYFKDPWNVFDFVIVAAAFMPFDAQYVTVLRLLRLLRVLRLVRAVPRLQVLVGTLLKSIPSIAYVSMLLFLLFYVYAVAGTFLFGANDPLHFGRLEVSLLSLFGVVTLEGWVDLMHIQMRGCALAGYEGTMELCTASTAQPLVGAAYFVSFILFGTMIVLNLFIGVIVNGMTEAQYEADDERRAAEGYTLTADDELDAIERHLAELGKQVGSLRHRLTAHRTPPGG